MLKINKETKLTPDLIKRVIEGHSSEAARLAKLEKYYLTKNEILNRQMADATKPNNKIANAFASYITDTLTGYFMGEPIKYSSLDTSAVEELNLICEYNDEADINMELARASSIFGVAYELTYIDEEGNIRFRKLDTKECIPIYDDSIEEDLLYFIRYYKTYDLAQDKYSYSIEVYSSVDKTIYTANESISTVSFVEKTPHFFGLVPVAVYRNNDYMIGDFESVISLIDAYDKMTSDTLNDFEYLSDAYLALYGFTAEAEDIQDMKEKRVLLMDEGTKAEWLIKDAPDTSIENTKDRLDSDIHRFTKCPNLLDEKFAANSSGVAIKFKMIGTENLTAIKERKFKKGLQRRLELITAINGLKGAGFDWRSIDISFVRSIPANDSEAANMIAQLKGLVSNETLISQLSFVDNVEDELKRIKEQKEEDQETMLNNPLQQENIQEEVKIG